MEHTVLELLAAALAERKAKLDMSRVDTVFKVGDQMLLRIKELLDAADIGKLRPRWDAPLYCLSCARGGTAPSLWGCPSSNAYSTTPSPPPPCRPRGCRLP